MRQNLVFFILLGLLGVLGISLATRERQPHGVALPAPSASPEPAASASAAASTAPAPSGSAATVAAPAGLGRPLQVSGAAWETLAPIILANDGLEPKKESDAGKAGLEVSVKLARDDDALQAALARGGADDAGADLVVIPLAGLLGAYQKLQALRPVAIYASAWSRGREVLSGKQPLDKLPPAGEVTLALGSDPASSFFALFTLDLAGVPPARVRPAERGDAKIHVHALTRAELEPKDQKDVLLSTSDATRFAPYVLVCSAALVEKHPGELSKFLSAWLDGVQRLTSDPTASARRISTLEGAPEPIALLGRLSELAPIGLAENAELFGLSGRGAVTLDSLLSRLWRLGREAKLVNVAPPERAPIAPGLVAQLVRADPARAKDAAAPSPAKAKPGARPLLVVRRPAPLDADAAEAELGFVAGVFQRSPIRVSAADRKLGEALAKRSAERFALSDGRLTVGTLAAGAGAAVIEILPIP